MNKVVKEMWVDALRSGEFQQICENLHDGSNFCALGVLYELYRRDTGKGVWKLVSRGNEYELTEISDMEVCEWAGVEDLYFLIQLDSLAYLTDLNDEGNAFTALALLIEEQY